MQPMSEPDATPPPHRADAEGAMTLVVGLDGSDTSWRAAAYAVGMVRRYGGRSRLVFVYVRSNPGLRALVPQVVPASVEAADLTVAQIVETLRRALEGLEWELRNPTGSPFVELRRVATAVRADTVVVGASSGLAHRVAGSLAARLVKTRRWPVIVVP
jgi:nucleotide-binding universal stress UspA family protein